MLLAATLLSLLPAVVISGQNTPAGWACAPLAIIKASHADCLASAHYDGSTWSIRTKKVDGGIERFCVITLSGAGIKENQDFYVKGTFKTTEIRGPYGGISFNMEGTKNGNYVMMRLKNARGNVEAGRLLNMFKKDSKTSSISNAAVAAGLATLEILVNEGVESVYINGVLQKDISDYQPFHIDAGAVGFAFQNAKDWGLKISEAEVCSHCIGDNGQKYKIGESYTDGDETCTCTAAGGMECECDTSLTCPDGTTLWENPHICEPKCIKSPAYCSSSSDPHYKTFDGLSYSFHGRCTYQAASCYDFKVYFKNIELTSKTIRYTRRIELVFKAITYSIEAGYKAEVAGVLVQVPYIKIYTNGDRVEIKLNGGELEIYLFNMGRKPSVKLRATHRGPWINAEMWLHGSCADITEGVCGNWDGDANNDIAPSINTMGESFKQYDEHCEAPPNPEDPCITSEGKDARATALAICASLIGGPFRECNKVVPVGDDKRGIMFDCSTDVCFNFNDKAFACDQLEMYAQACINNGFDVADWRRSTEIDFCPFECREGQTYRSDGRTPEPSCLDRNPTQTGTQRGCFCPRGQFVQDGTCVNENQCKCSYEGKFYDAGQTITKDSECEKCICKEFGKMTCEGFTCLPLNCASDELEAKEDDECCPICLSGWVEALDSDVTVKQGQNAELTCVVKVEDVIKANIKWYKDDEEITIGISKDRLVLTVTNSEVEDSGNYTCEATKEGVTARDDFNVTVVGPQICTLEDGTEWEEGTEYNSTETAVVCTCDQTGQHDCVCPDTSTYKSGPKPAPSCKIPDGGTETQTACFCPEGQILVDEKCVDMECGCKYNGDLYMIGDTFVKPEDCLSCKCNAGGEDCQTIKCEKECNDDEIDVKEEECCPECLAEWVKAVNPKAEGEMGESLALTCNVEGVEVTADNVKWIRNPGNEDVTQLKKQYFVSQNGLILTIKKMDDNFVGEYKCVVEKDGKTKEATFKVTLPVVKADLVDAVNKEITLSAGDKMLAECNILKAGTEVTWTCNGKKMDTGLLNVKTSIKKSVARLTIDPVETDDAGTCTCSAKGVGTEDSDDIQIIVKDNEIKFTAVKDPVNCIEKSSESCRLQWKIVSPNGARIKEADVKICKFTDGKLLSCKRSNRKSTYEIKLSKKRKISDSGEYVAVANIDGSDARSDPITVNITAKN